MPSFGENLKRQRELRGIELREISEATKISLRFLQALETDRVDILPGGIFRRSFVREYARHVGLDADRLVAEFAHAHGDDAPEKKAAHSPSAGFYRRLFLAVALAAAGAGAWGITRGSVRPAVVPIVAVARPQVFASDGLLSATSQPVTPVAGSMVLTLTAREDCWVRVEAEGRVLLEATLASGRSETVQTASEMVLSVGNAAALDVRINDRLAQPLGARGEVRKNIVINKESLSSLVEDQSPRRTANSG
jgi:cytoskeleton protein RodZ